MKTLYILLLSLAVNSASVFGAGLSDPDKPSESKKTWMKSEKGSWLGGNSLWYKIDQKSNGVKYSNNQRKWKASTDVAWYDIHGNWFCFYQGKLMTKTDHTNWTESKDNTWQDLNGKWYRINENRELEETVEQERSLAEAN